MKSGMASWTLAAPRSPQLNSVSQWYTPCRHVSASLCANFIWEFKELTFYYACYYYHYFSFFFLKKSQRFWNLIMQKHEKEMHHVVLFSCFLYGAFGKRSIYTWAMRWSEQYPIFMMNETPSGMVAGRTAPMLSHSALTHCTSEGLLSWEGPPHWGLHQSHLG